MNTTQKVILGTLVLFVAVVWLSILQTPDNNVHIVACDVGQGDGILIYKGQTQIIIDGGPNNKIQQCLSKYMPFWDRKIEIVILTHPQSDHFFGLTEVFNRYYIEHYFSLSLEADGEEYKKLTEAIEAENTNIHTQKIGTTLRSSGITLDYLWPPAETVEAKSFGDDPNLYSAVFYLHYGYFDALFTGDTVPEVSDEILGLGQIRDIEYLKVPHHGSRNGLAQELLDALTPEIAVISSGGRYGHPHQEILDMLSAKNVKTLRTDQLGDIEVITDGKKWWYNQ